MVPRARHSQVPATSVPVRQGHPYPQPPHTLLTWSCSNPGSLLPGGQHTRGCRWKGTRTVAEFFP